MGFRYFEIPHNYAQLTFRQQFKSKIQSNYISLKLNHPLSSITRSVEKNYRRRTFAMLITICEFLPFTYMQKNSNQVKLCKTFSLNIRTPFNPIS